MIHAIALTYGFWTIPANRVIQAATGERSRVFCYDPRDRRTRFGVSQASTSVVLRMPIPSGMLRCYVKGGAHVIVEDAK